MKLSRVSTLHSGTLGGSFLLGDYSFIKNQNHELSVAVPLERKSKSLNDLLTPVKAHCGVWSDLVSGGESTQR